MDFSIVGVRLELLSKLMANLFTFSQKETIAKAYKKFDLKHDFINVFLFFFVRN